MFIQLLFSSPQTFAAMALVVVFSVCAHEYMHAYAALKNGDTTAADAGHLTMSPLKQMGLWSLVMLCMLGIAWGQVPVNPENLTTRKARLTVALAGVAANLGLSIIFTILAFLLMLLAPQQGFAFAVLVYGATVNLVLLAINLFPIPGFDGWNVLTEFYDPRLSSEFAKGALLIIAMGLFFGVKYIFAAAEFIVLLALGCMNMLIQGVLA